MGVKVKKNKTGKLAYRIIWKGLPGGSAWVTTQLLDTPENRRRMDASAALMTAEIKAGRFDYLQWFPFGSKSRQLSGKQEEPRTLQEYFDRWIADKKPPMVRKSAERDYRQHFRAYISATLGPRVMETISPLDIRTLRGKLLEDGLSLHTCKNIIAGTLRAMLRDAQIDGVIKRSPFEDLPRSGWWPRTEVAGPEPFTFDERARIIDWYYKNSRHFWPYVAFMMHQSLRPSEATALTWDKVDLSAGFCIVNRSRHLGAETATKTRQATRIVHLESGVVHILKQMRPIHAAEGVYVFTNTIGKPIDIQTFKKLWNRSLKAIRPAIRPRGFYACKDTAISLAISAGENVAKVAKEAGITITTLERHYGMYIERAVAKSETKSEINRPAKQKVANSKEFSWWSQRESNPLPSSLSESDKTALTPSSYNENRSVEESLGDAEKRVLNTPLRGKK